MKFKNFIFQAWKIMKFNVGHGIIIENNVMFGRLVTAMSK